MSEGQVKFNVDDRFPNTAQGQWIRSGGLLLEDPKMVDVGAKAIFDNLWTSLHTFRDGIKKIDETYIGAVRGSLYAIEIGNLSNEVMVAEDKTRGLVAQRNAWMEVLKPKITLTQMEQVTQHIQLWNIRNFLLQKKDGERWLIFAEATEKPDDVTVEAFVGAPAYFGLMKGSNFELGRVDEQLAKYGRIKNPDAHQGVMLLNRAVSTVTNFIESVKAELRQLSIKADELKKSSAKEVTVYLPNQAPIKGR